jgi:cellulose synthase/poly-beta-1,6-N-acetylglucosamine synthase-like glycosyltransferase
MKKSLHSNNYHASRQYHRKPVANSSRPNLGGRIIQRKQVMPERSLKFLFELYMLSQDIKNNQTKKKLALLIAAHNEALVIENTLQSAIDAGMRPENIYVVDDNSNDGTAKKASAIIPEQNVTKVRRSGKGLALTKAAKKFKLTKRYEWIHIADADGAFAPNYFSVFKPELNDQYVAATGYIRSLPGRHVSQYRAFEYTIGMEIHRRFQSLFNVIPIIPGPTSCFRSDVFEKLNFANKSLTEDFDVTLQIHRLKLGKIQFIPKAVAYTQDPATTGDFVKQISRWNRGVMQGIYRHGIGRKMTGIDAYLSYQVFLNLLLFFNYFVVIPIFALKYGGTLVIAATFLIDVWLTLFMTMLVAARLGRWDLLGAFPQIYWYKWVNLGVFLKSFVEVAILRKFRATDGVWMNDASRRYEIGPSAS